MIQSRQSLCDMKSTLHLRKKVRRVTSGYLVPSITLHSHILTALHGIKYYITMHIPIITALKLKKSRRKGEAPSSFIGRGLGIIQHEHSTMERGAKKETLWLGVEPRLPAFRQMFSIKLTSKCTNRYTTKDWCFGGVCNKYIRLTTLSNFEAFLWDLSNSLSD
jgi:hypothetical protein